MLSSPLLPHTAPRRYLRERLIGAPHPPPLAPRTNQTPAGPRCVPAVLQKASEEVETTYPAPPEFVAQGDRVLVVGVATGKIKATNKPFKDDWVFDITVRDGKVTKIREFIDTQALARASQMDASGPA
jgi:uncharacterized protein